MAKRFTDSNRWKKQAWLKQLDPYYKLAWVYISDECDHAGIWKIDVVDLKEYTGIPDFNLTEFIEACNKDYDKLTGEEITRERLKIVDDKYLWITGFMTFQYGGKNEQLPKNNIVLSAIENLESLSLLNKAISKGFINPSERLSEHLQKGSARVKDKDKVKDKGSNEVLDKEDNEKTFNPTSSEIESIYQEYPRKVGKAAALTKIRTSLKELNDVEGINNPVKWLRSKVKEFADSPKGQAGQYCPYPATWFNQSRYLDDTQEWQVKQQENGHSSNGIRKTRGDRQEEQFFTS